MATAAPPAAAGDAAPDRSPAVAPRLPDRRVPTPPSTIGLALQGGGAHGAFTWGVLDRLLDEPRLAFPIVTGASAGALNGAMLVSGFANGGRAGARKALADLWEGVGRIGALVAPFQANASRSVTDLGLTGAGMMQAMLRMWSPVQLNPFDVDPLRDLLESLVDVEALRRYQPMRLFVSATDVETGAARLFSGDALSVDALMASACLPTLYQAVRIDGRPYWDGGYSANPPLMPFLEAAADVAVAEALLVQINPARRAGAPDTASAIVHRVSEITFNAGLLAELRLFDALRTGDRPVPRIHRIALHDDFDGATGANAASLDESFHRELRDHGRRTATRWLETAWHASRARRRPTPLGTRGA